MQAQSAYQSLLAAHEALQQQVAAGGGAGAAAAAADAGLVQEVTRLEGEVRVARDGLIAERARTASLQEEVGGREQQFGVYRGLLVTRRL